jgi:signal transduction histidine kinase
MGAERASRQAGHGLGLGLAIVRAIADAHGASLTATARPGGGLEVAVIFPQAGL